MGASFSRRSLVLTLLLTTFFALPSQARAGAWTTPEGALWTKLTLLHLDSDQLFVDANRVGRFCGSDASGNAIQLESGDRAPYDCTLEGGGGLLTTQLMWEASFGFHERFDVAIKVPYFLNAEFSTPFTPESRSGFGDTYLSMRGNILMEPVVLTTGLILKAPTGFFTQDAVGIPLGEGQWDLESRTQVARSFDEFWLGAEVAYRLRLPNEELGNGGLNIGDEVIGVIEGGYRPLPWLYIPLRWELMVGFESTDQAETPFPNIAGRRYLTVKTGLLVNPLAHTEGPFKTLGVELGVIYPIWGEGWPADPIFLVGVDNTFRLFGGES